MNTKLCAKWFTNANDRPTCA